VKPDIGNTAFQLAWREHAPALEGRGLAREYFREEVMSVLKGRDVPDLETYLALDRVGRKTPLKADVRREVWALKERYDAELASRSHADLVDLLRLARDEVRRDPLDRWAGVVVDEVQDLPLVGLQLLYELAGRDRADGLLVVGDGQQAIYPGGFRLSDAGITVTGRAVVLRTNYRNTVEILAAARAVVARDGYEDLDARVVEPDLSIEVVRHGELPSTGSYGSLEEHDAALFWDLSALIDRGARPSDNAVLCATNTLAEGYARTLASKGVPAVLLKNDRATADGVKVGTWFRSKGMEYAHVFLPQIDRTMMLHTGAGHLDRDEKAELMRRTLYVAMTRARDTLWTGQVSA
jgi:superfamily I DNA/RNA helicase